MLGIQISQKKKAINSGEEEKKKRNLKQMPSESPSAKSQMRGTPVPCSQYRERVSITCSLPLVGLFQYFMLIHYHCNTPSFIFIQRKEL